MNEKTAKLLRKYAKATETNLNDLKRQWNNMNQFERRDFRERMWAAVDGEGPAEEASPEDLEAAESDEAAAADPA